MRDFNVLNRGDDTYINVSRNQSVNENARKCLILVTFFNSIWQKQKSTISFKTAYSLDT